MTARFCFWIQGPTHYNRAVIIEGQKEQCQMLATPGTWKEATVSMATLLVIGLRMDIQAQNMGWRRSRSGRPAYFHGVCLTDPNRKSAVWTAQECGVGSPAWNGP